MITQEHATRRCRDHMDSLHPGFKITTGNSLAYLGISNAPPLRWAKGGSKDRGDLENKAGYKTRWVHKYTQLLLGNNVKGRRR